MSDERSEARRATRVKLLRDRLCVDLVNSANWIGNEVADEAFETPEDVLTWMARALPLEKQALRRWRQGLRAQPASGSALVERVVRNRADIRQMLLGRCERTGASRAGNAAMKRLLAEAAPLAPAPIHGLHIRPDGPGDMQGRWFTTMAAHSAVELVLSPDGEALRRCEGDRCGWLFLDRSRSRRRRWCMMESCGNRAKSRAHYSRHRQAGA